MGISQIPWKENRTVDLNHVSSSASIRKRQKDVQ